MRLQDYKFKLTEMLSKYDNAYDNMDSLNNKKREKKNIMVTKIKKEILSFIQSNVHVISFYEGLPISDSINRYAELNYEGHDGFKVEIHDFIERIEEKLQKQ